MQPSEVLSKVESPLVKYLVEKSLAALLARYSLFAFGPVNYFVSKLLSKLFTDLIDAGVLAQKFKEIDHKVDKQVDELTKAQAGKNEQEIIDKARNLIDLHR